MKLFSRAAAMRLGGAFAIAALGVVWAWAAWVRMPGRSYRGALLPLEAGEEARRDRLRADVVALSGSIGERSVRAPVGLARAATFVEESLAHAGLTPARQTYSVEDVPCANVEAEVPGGARRGEIVLVGAHYDAVAYTRGADDNASGTAALLELARGFAPKHPSRTVRFVAFVNEEPPYFQTERMGSLVYARRSRARQEDIVAMLSLESIGCFSDAEGSQHYPPPLGLAYPGVGDFIGFVGDASSGTLVRRVVSLFRRATPFPSEGASPPAWVPGVGWSDPWSFWQVGYPGVMVTDTAPFRNPRYHLRSDTADQVDYDRMTRVVAGLSAVVDALANE